MNAGRVQLAGAHLPRRDRLIILAALGTVSALAWLYLVLGASHMDMAADARAGMGMMIPQWTAARLLFTFLMWAVMMAAMMLPSAAPAILTYAAVVNRIAPGQNAIGSTMLFTGAYVLVWTGFSVGATLLQWGLDRATLLSPEMASASALLGGALLILAGLYQWTPLKDFCLKHCQTPLSFLANHWRPGEWGALLMGVRHGLYCVGCCWALMLLLFVGGVMDLLWVAGISMFILLEKLMGDPARRGRWLSGAVLLMAGLLFLVE